MLKTLIQYQMYIIIGILVFPIFAFIIYFTKNLIDRAKFVRTLHNMKKPLMERINNVEIIYAMKEQQEEVGMIINDIKSDIHGLKREINVSQGMLQLEKIDHIEEEISTFYDKMTEDAKTKDQRSMPIQTTQQTRQQQTALQKEQVRIMNENISKFMVVCKEKNKLIEERNTTIALLQQKLSESQQQLKTFMEEHKDDKDKDSIIEEKTKAITVLQQRIQEVESKFGKIVALHQSMTEREQMKDVIIDEKNRFIANLQNKFDEIENKLQSMVTINEENKERFLDKKLVDIDEKIQTEKKKNLILMVLFILFLLLGIGGFIFVYTYYIQTGTAYTI